jgi:hypothetical protein
VITTRRQVLRGQKRLDGDDDDDEKLVEAAHSVRLEAAICRTGR